MLLAWSALLGGAAGLMGGLLGIGGGVVIVPVLVLLLDARDLVPAAHITHVAVGSSLLSIVFTSFAAARAQMRRGAVRWEIFRTWAPCLIAGSFAAGFVAAWIPTGYLRVFIALFLSAVAVIMLTAWTPHPHRQLPSGIGSASLASVAGLISGLAGIGGGNVIVPTLVYFNVAIHSASATASALGVPIAAAGCLGYVISGWGLAGLPSGSLGYVFLPAVTAIVVVSVLTAPMGVALAHRISAQRLKRVFGAVLLVVSARMMLSAWQVF